MKVDEFVTKAKDTALLQTCYLMGGFGCRLGKDWYNANYTWNKNNAKIIDAHKNTNPITFGFDCVCLVKGILWGFTGNESKEYGGAVYESNNVGDITIAAFKKSCSDLSTDFTKDPEAGELLFLGNSHIGISIGNGEVIESTPAWRCGVQRTLLPSRNTTNYEKLPVRKWDMHGHSSYIDFDDMWKDAYAKLSNKYAELEIKHNNATKTAEALQLKVNKLTKIIEKAKETLTNI